MEHQDHISNVEISTLAFDTVESINKVLENHGATLDIEDDKAVYEFLIKILKKYE